MPTKSDLRDAVNARLKEHGVTARPEHLELALALTLFSDDELDRMAKRMRDWPIEEWMEEEWN